MKDENKKRTLDEVFEEPRSHVEEDDLAKETEQEQPERLEGHRRVAQGTRGSGVLHGGGSC